MTWCWSRIHQDEGRVPSCASHPFITGTFTLTHSPMGGNSVYVEAQAWKKNTMQYYVIKIISRLVQLLHQCLVSSWTANNFLCVRKCVSACVCVWARVRISALLFKLHKLSVYCNNHTEGSPQQCAKFGEDRRMHLKINLLRLTMHSGVSCRVETVPCVLCPCAGTSLRWNSVCDSRRA